MTKGQRFSYRYDTNQPYILEVVEPTSEYRPPNLPEACRSIPSVMFKVVDGPDKIGHHWHLSDMQVRRRFRDGSLRYIRHAIVVNAKVQFNDPLYDLSEHDTRHLNEICGRKIHNSLDLTVAEARKVRDSIPSGPLRSAMKSLLFGVEYGSTALNPAVVAATQEEAQELFARFLNK